MLAPTSTATTINPQQLAIAIVAEGTKFPPAVDIGPRGP
jgi:hypothetical protein